MIPTDVDKQSIVAQAVDHLTLINQNQAAKVVQASSIEFALSLEKSVGDGERLVKLAVTLRAPSIIDSEPVVESQKEWVHYFAQEGLNYALAKFSDGKADFFHIETLNISWQESRPNSADEIDKNKRNNQGIGDYITQKWVGLRFGSEAEVRVAKVLDERGVMFLPNCLARLNIKGGRTNRMPDFLVCHEGKWGILEVDGPHHTSAARDHDRDRLFKSHGVKVVERFSADECKDAPHKVVDEFLMILGKQ